MNHRGDKDATVIADNINMKPPVRHAYRYSLDNADVPAGRTLRRISLGKRITSKHQRPTSTNV